MGNFISKINKDRFFVYEEYMKNKTSLEKGKTRRTLEMGAHSLLRSSKIMPLAPIQTGAWWRSL